MKKQLQQHDQARQLSSLSIAGLSTASAAASRRTKHACLPRVAPSRQHRLCDVPGVRPGSMNEMIDGFAGCARCFPVELRRSRRIMTAACAVTRARLCGRVLAGSVGWKMIDAFDAADVDEVDRRAHYGQWLDLWCGLLCRGRQKYFCTQ